MVGLNQYCKINFFLLPVPQLLARCGESCFDKKCKLNFLVSTSMAGSSCNKSQAVSVKNVKSHILDSNGVWYSSFWSEGPKNHRNLKILVSKFVPRGFEARRTRGFEAQRHGVSRGGAGVSRGSAKGFRGAAPLIKDFSDLSFCAVPRGPW